MSGTMTAQGWFNSYSEEFKKLKALEAELAGLQAENKSLKQTQDKVWNEAVEACIGLFPRKHDDSATPRYDSHIRDHIRALKRHTVTEPKETP